MTAIRRLLLLVFLESFATIIVERGIYFFTDEQFHFLPVENLWLALAFGVAYFVGAALSHRVALRLTEKSVVFATVLSQLALHVLLSVRPSPGVIVASTTAIGLLNGLKWPVVESYISAGLTPAQTARALGWFNIAWASAVPLSLGVVGPLIRLCQSWMFLVPAAMNLAGLALALPLPTRPLHLPADHPDRPPPGQLPRLRALLRSSQMLLLVGYSSMWVLAAWSPEIFKRLGFGVAAATVLAALLDGTRAAAFAGLHAWAGWHYRPRLLVLSAGGMLGGFLMVLLGRQTALVLGGEVVFGLAIGLVYFSSLYYSMVVKNASVDAGGAHEGLIGLGFALGPAAGLVGIPAAHLLGSTERAVVVGVLLLFAAAFAAAMRPWRGIRG